MILENFFGKLFNYLEQFEMDEIETMIENYNYIKPEEEWKDQLDNRCIDSFSFNIFLNISYLFPLSTKIFINNSKQKYKNIAYNILKKMNNSLFEQ